MDTKAHDTPGKSSTALPLFNSFILLVVVGGFFGMALRPGWLVRETFVYNLRMSLFKAHLEPPSSVKLATQLATEFQPGVTEKMPSFWRSTENSDKSMQEFSKYLCHLPYSVVAGMANPCVIASELHQATLALWVCAGLCIKFLCGGVFMEFRYRSSHDGSHRRTAQLLYFLAPVALLIGLAIYYQMGGVQLNQLFPKTDQQVVGECFLGAVGLQLVAFLPFVLISTIGKTSEEAIQELSEKMKIDAEAGQGQYGAAQQHT